MRLNVIKLGDSGAWHDIVFMIHYARVLLWCVWGKCVIKLNLSTKFFLGPFETSQLHLFMFWVPPQYRGKTFPYKKRKLWWSFHSFELQKRAYAQVVGGLQVHIFCYRKYLNILEYSYQDIFNTMKTIRRCKKKTFTH